MREGNPWDATRTGARKIKDLWWVQIDTELVLHVDGETKHPVDARLQDEEENCLPGGQGGEEGAVARVGAAIADEFTPHLLVARQVDDQLGAVQRERDDGLDEQNQQDAAEGAPGALGAPAHVEHRRAIGALPRLAVGVRLAGEDRK
jgi:hypothetical protein